jgi:alpha-D-ribose 1-methylphosphonate 5-triphosphate synthase subunit PhnH
MQITHSTQTGAVTIKLTDTETRQFMSSSAAVEAVRKAIDQAKGMPLEQRKS